MPAEDTERLRAALQDARRTAHQLNNDLTLLIGYGELLEELVDGEAAELLQHLLRGGRQSVETLRELQRQIREADQARPP